MQYYICCFKIQYTLQTSAMIVYIKPLRPAYESGLFVVHIYSLLMQNFFDFFMFYLLTFNSWSFFDKIYILTAFQRWPAKRNTKRHSLLSKIRRRLCLYIIKRIQFTVSITSVIVATVGVVHNSESWLLFKIYLFYYTRDRGVCQ